MNSKNIPEVIKQLGEFGYSQIHIRHLTKLLKNKAFTWDEIIDKMNALEQGKLVTQTVQIMRSERIFK